MAMWRGRTRVWTLIGSVIAALAVVLVLIHLNSDAPPEAASSPAPPTSAGASTQAGESTPGVPPETSGTSSVAYLSDLKPSGDLGELVSRGPATISGAVYPKSISFYCNVGDQTAFPEYHLPPHARRFQATIGLPAESSPDFRAGIILVGDTRTLQTFTVSVQKPKTVDVHVAGLQTLQLECFGSGNSSTGGEAIAVAWGNARFAGRH
jgi:hypothetical protein